MLLRHHYQTLENPDVWGHNQKTILYVDIELLKKNNNITKPLKIMMYVDNGHKQ